MTHKREWWVVPIVLGVVLLLQVPYLLGYLTAPADSMYTGLLVNVEDANYITIIQRGRDGAWQHSLRFTSEPDAPAFLYVFYLALGHLARAANLEATTMWHAARAGMTLLTFLVAYGFVRFFFHDQRARWTAFLLAILGAGFDWLVFPRETLAPTAATPVDLKMADAHLFHAALTFPHYLASITCLMILFWCALRLMNETLTRRNFWALLFLGAAANLGVTLVYPFLAILSCSVLGTYVVLRMLCARAWLWRQFFLAAALCLLLVPVVWYYARALVASELLRVWAAQSQTLSPNPLHYLLSFAPFLFFALWGLWRTGLGDNKRLLLWAWVFCVAVLVYAPLGAQRRFLQGVQIPLAILATYGLFEVALPRVRQTRWFQALARRPRYSADGLARLLIVLIILLTSLSSAYQWLSAVSLTTLLQPYPMFRPRSEVAAMDWLRVHAQNEDVILSAYLTGSYLPYRSGARVYLGHYYETIHFEQKQAAVEKFFSAVTTEEMRVEFLRVNGIDYLFYGSAERALGGFDPAKFGAFEPVYADAAIEIYKQVLSER